MARFTWVLVMAVIGSGFLAACGSPSPGADEATVSALSACLGPQAVRALAGDLADVLKLASVVAADLAKTFARVAARHTEHVFLCTCGRGDAGPTVGATRLETIWQPGTAPRHS